MLQLPAQTSKVRTGRRNSAILFALVTVSAQVVRR